MLNSETITLGDYLDIKKGQFVIPFSQRKYEWGKPETKRLFDDLVSLYEDQDGVHPLNFFTFSDDSELKIFDGQQRTITCMLLLAVIAQKLNTLGFTNPAGQIRESYFVKKDYLHKTQQDTTFKLLFDQKEVGEFFYKITSLDYHYVKDLKRESASDRKDSKKVEALNPSDFPTNSNMRALAANYIFLNDEFDRFLASIDAYKEKPDVVLSDIVTAITDKSFLVMLIAANEKIALNMFESLNNTGKDLEKYYVLKSNIVDVLGEEEVKPYWQHIDSNLLNIPPTSFLVAVATILNGKTSQNQVLPAIYQSFQNDSSHDMKELLKLLSNASEKYAYIKNPQLVAMPRQKSQVKEYRYLTELLDSFKIKQQFPIILAMLLKSFPLDQINKVLRAVLTVGVRNFYFNEEKANTLENPFAKYAEAIYHESFTTSEILKNIYKHAASDDVVKTKVVGKYIMRNAPAAAILRILYNNELKNDDVEVSTQGIDLEHIMPRRPKKTSKWLRWFPNDETRDKYTHSIGNLTLWVDHRNRGSQNAEFSEKRELYLESSLQDNRMIAHNTQWTAKEISSRSNELAQRIVEHLNVPQTYD